MRFNEINFNERSPALICKVLKCMLYQMSAGDAAKIRSILERNEALGCKNL